MAHRAVSAQAPVLLLYCPTASCSANFRRISTLATQKPGWQQQVSTPTRTSSTSIHGNAQERSKSRCSPNLQLPNCMKSVNRLMHPRTEVQLLRALRTTARRFFLTKASGLQACMSQHKVFMPAKTNDEFRDVPKVCVVKLAQCNRRRRSSKNCTKRSSNSAVWAAWKMLRIVGPTAFFWSHLFRPIHGPSARHDGKPRRPVAHCESPRQEKKSPRRKKIHGSRRGPQGQSAGQRWSRESFREDIAEIERRPVDVGNVSRREGKEAGHSTGCRKREQGRPAGDVSGRGTRPQDMRGRTGTAPSEHPDELGCFRAPPATEPALKTSPQISLAPETHNFIAASRTECWS